MTIQELERQLLQLSQTDRQNLTTVFNIPSDPKILESLFQSWEEQDDEEEQKETWEYLRRVLDEDRSSNRPLFP